MDHQKKEDVKDAHAHMEDQPESASCFGGGDIAGAVFGTLIVLLLLEVVGYLLYTRYWRHKRENKLMVTDPENAKDDFAFDNAGFHGEVAKENKVKSLLDTKWLPIATFSKQKADKKRTQDDTATVEHQTYVVPLRGKDFTGLGFDIFGGLRDGIFVKDIRHTGPAYQSGLIQPGARIKSIRVDFEHIVFEDALNILSSASPYDVQIEIATSGVPAGTLIKKSSQNVGRVTHPLYRSNSTADASIINKGKKKQYDSLTDPSDYPTLKLEKSPGGKENTPRKVEKSSSPATTVERKPATLIVENEKMQMKSIRSTIDELNIKMAEVNKPERAKRTNINAEENTTHKEPEIDGKKGLKFGIRVLPPNVNDKIFGKQKPLSENDNNVNIERNEVVAVEQPVVPIVKRRNRDNREVHQKQNDHVEVQNPNFTRDGSLNSSGIKRDSSGIPQEIPNHMLQAALAARNNRKSAESVSHDEVDIAKSSREEIIGGNRETYEQFINGEIDTDMLLENSNYTKDEEMDKAAAKLAKKSKGKAPAPPPVADSKKFKPVIEFKNLNTTDTDMDISTETNETNLSVDVTDTMSEDSNLQNFVLDFDLIENVPERMFEKTMVQSDILNRSDDSIILTDRPSNSSTPKSSKKSLKSEEANSDTESIIQQNNKTTDESDSDVEIPNTSPSGTTIELNSSDITIHHISPTEDMDNETRRTASLGDLSRFTSNGVHQKLNTNSGTLERAQSLDISDQNEQNLSPKKRKAQNGALDVYNSIEETYSHFNKEPKMTLNSHIMNSDGLNTFQRNRLKKSSEWGNLEDAIFHKNSSEASSSDNLYLSSEHEYKEMFNSTKVNIPSNLKFDFSSDLPSEDTNISDDIKVSRHSYESLERPKTQDVVGRNSSSELSINSYDVNSQPISLMLIQNNPEINITANVIKSKHTPTFTSDFKGVNSISINNEDSEMPKTNDITESNVTITNNQPSSIICIESAENKNVNTINVTSSDIEFNEDDHLPKLPTSNIPTNLSYNISDIELPVLPSSNIPMNLSYNISDIELPVLPISNIPFPANLSYNINDIELPVLPTLTKSYVTEIQVKTQKSDNSITNDESQSQTVSETIVSALEENNLKNGETTITEIKPKNYDFARNSEIKFSTSTYEQPKTEKRLSQIELLRSNFEKSSENAKGNLQKPIVSSKPNLSPSKIPVFNSKVTEGPKSPVRQSVSVTAIKSSSRHPSGK